MGALPDAEVLDRLDRERAVWICTLRPDGSSHLTPVWFLFVDGEWWVCTPEGSVKIRNVRADPRVSLALPDPDAPLVAEGVATVVRPPFRSDIVAGFRDRYDGWDITKDWPGGSFVLLRVSVARWLLDGRAR